MPLAAAAQPGGEVVIDGIAVLAGGLMGDESAASPVLLSDIELEARLILLRSFGPAWSEKEIGDDLMARARRRVAYTRLMARQARQIGEEIQPGQKVYLRKQLVELADGEEGLANLVKSCGAAEKDLGAWIEDALLAMAQLTYLRERIEPPTEEELERLFAAGGHPFEGEQLESVKRRFMNHVAEQRVRSELMAWLRSTLEHRKIRLVQ